MKIRGLLPGVGIATLAACTPAPANNQTVATDKPVIRVAAAASGPDGCSATIDGAPIAMSDLTARIDAARGLTSPDPANTLASAIEQNRVEVVTPPDVRFDCAALVMINVMLGGVYYLPWATTGGGPRVTVTPYLLNEQPPEQVITIVADRSIRWNGQPIELAALRQRAPASREYAVIADPALPASAVIEVLAALGQANLRLIAPGQPAFQREQSQLSEPRHSLPSQMRVSQMRADQASANQTGEMQP